MLHPYHCDLFFAALFATLLWGCSSPKDTNPITGGVEKPVVEQSTVYPYGLKYQLHANSASVNTPPHSSCLMEPIGNTGANNQFAVPTIVMQDAFKEKRYFDSSAPDGGDGTENSPYNTLTIITKLEYPDNCALLLKAGSTFYSSSLNSSTSQKNIYFSSYGEGIMPIVTNVDHLTNPATFGGICGFDGENITVNGIHIVGGGTGSYDRLINIGGKNLTFANCHIESINTPHSGYLFNIFKGGAENMTLYRCEIAFARDDIWYASSNGSYTIVSNYFHHANMSTYSASNFSPSDRTTWKPGGGDIIQFEYENLNGAYIANNFFDKSDSAAKFTLIFNGGSTNKNVVVLCNTFIGPMSANGGAAMQWHTAGVLKNNLFLNADPKGGVSALASYPTFATGISGNHFVGYTKSSAFWNLTLSDITDDNIVYSDLETYTSSVKPDARLGSSLF